VEKWKLIKIEKEKRRLKHQWKDYIIKSDLQTTGMCIDSMKDFVRWSWDFNV